MSLLCSRLFSLFLYVYFYTCYAQEEYILFEITTFSERERRILYQYYITDERAYFINGITNEAAIPIIALTRPPNINFLISFLKSNEIQFSYDANPIRFNGPDSDSSGEDMGNFTQYFHEYQEVEAWVNESLAVYPKELQKIVIGKTFENRELFILKVGREPKNFAVFILGCEQSRDWASPAMIINMANKMLHREGVLRPLMQLYDFYFMPFMNPDGYTFSRTRKRLWMMNRRIIKVPRHCPKEQGIGVALDRNWFFKARPIEDVCLGLNIGLEPISEQETKALSQYLNGIAPKLLAFINLRGFGRYVTIPYGFTEVPVQNHQILMQIVDSAAKSKSYYYESSNFLLYNFTGSVADWVKRELNIPFVCTIYSNPSKGLIPKESDIQPLTDEVSEMLSSILQISKDFYGPLFNTELKHSSSSLLWLCFCGLFFSKIINQYNSYS